MAKSTKPEIGSAPTGWEILMAFGPGMVWASMSIGGGELVLIPRVGSVFGMMVLWMPLLAIVLKYFMVNEIGRWTVLTGRSISDGFALLPGPRAWLNWIILIVAIYLGAVHIGGLVAMVGAITHNMLPVLPPFGWSLILMLSFIALTWTGKYNPLEMLMKVVTAILVISAVIIAAMFFPGLGEVLKGFGFQVPGTTPDWAVNQFKIAKNPMAEILPAMAFAGAGAINSLWYSDWVLGKGLGLGKTYEGDKPGIPVEELKRLDRGVLDRVANWYRVMFHDNLWAGNFLTILVTAAFMINAIVILNPQKIAPAGAGFILTLSKTYTQTLGAWAYWLFMVGAWAVIYGTMATCYDGYARLINRTLLICLPNWKAYARIHPTWRYRIWMLYGTVCNFVLVYLLQAVPVTFLQAAAWVEGTFLLPVVALAIAYLTSVVMPRLFPADAGGPYRPHWLFPVGCVAAAALYVILIVMLLRN
jgi:Mn2+/Fe2+ NRAMP family transporter